jgi:hypothetical protein
MPGTLDRCILATALLGALATEAAAAAADLPPREAPAYSATYRMSSRSRAEADVPWKFFDDDKVTISVAGKKSRWDFAKGGKTILNDHTTHHTTTYGGTVPAGKALRQKAPFVPIGWEYGYATVAGDKTPAVLGTATIAGRECVRLKFESEDYGTPEYCVAKNGIVLRFANQTPTAEATYEAETVSDTAPAGDKFAVPSNLQVEERRAPRRSVDIF